MKFNWTKTVVALGLVATLAGVGVSVASAGSKTATLDALTVHPKSTLKIGFFAPGSSNTYAALVTSSGAKEAKILGVKLTTLSAAFDTTTQEDQLQLALSRKTYNAWIVVPLDPQAECGILKQAVAAGIKVEMATTPACSGTGPAGGLGVSAVQDLGNYQKWWDYILSHTTPGQIAVMVGGSTDYVTQICDEALAQAMKKYPGFTVVSNEALDYSTSGAFSDAQDLLKSYPNLKAIVSDYSGMTQGAVEAVGDANDVGTVKVFDMDGDNYILHQIMAGTVQMTIPGLPISESEEAVKIVVENWEGKATPKNYNPLSAIKFPNNPFITKANVDSYKPQY